LPQLDEISPISPPGSFHKAIRLPEQPGGNYGVPSADAEFTVSFLGYGTNIRLELFGQMLSAIAKGYGCTRAARFFRRDHAAGVWRELLR
jgi:hypothetical protein